jgi:hypothetical protein
MSAYDAFLVELFQYTGKDTLKDLSYEELSRATNKVCKQIYGAKPTEDQKKEQANIKRKVKMEWKKENETEEGVIKTSMYEEKAEVKEEYAEQVAEVQAEAEQLAEKVRSKAQTATEVTEDHVEALAGALRFSGTETDLKAEQAVEELRKIAAQKYKQKELVQEEEEKKEIAEEEIKHEEEIDISSHIAHTWALHLNEQEMLQAENRALHLANTKLHGLIDGLCIGSGLVLSGLLVIMLLYKFI